MANEAIQDYQNRAMRNKRLLNLGYRNARRSGNIKQALEFANMGDSMGLPIGRPARIEEIRGSGTDDYYNDMRMSGRQPEGGGLDFDFRHSSQGGPGVGGYNFNQRTRVPSFAPVPRTGAMGTMDANGVPTAAGLTKAQPSSPVLPSPEGGQTSGGYALTQPQEMPDEFGPRVDSLPDPGFTKEPLPQRESLDLRPRAGSFTGAPYRQNPIRRARSEFFEEPVEREFFVPVGQGRTGFGEFISPAKAVANRRMLEDFADHQDARATKSAENATRRLELGSRSRMMPFQEAAEIAQAKANRAKSESAMRLNPFLENTELEQTQLQREQAAAQRKSLPGDEAARTAARDAGVERLRFADPMQDELSKYTKEPSHLLAYEHFRDTAPPEMKSPEQRQRYAYGQSLRLAQDAEAVAALWDAYSEGQLDEAAIGELTESVDDASGNHFGYRVRNSPEARSRVNSILANYRNRRTKFQEEKEARRETIARDTQFLTSLAREIDDLSLAIKEGGGTDAMKARLAEAMADREALHKSLRGGYQPKAASPEKPVENKKLPTKIR